MYSPFTKITYILTSPTTSLEFHRAIWNAVSQAIVLILPQIKFNSQLSCCTFFLKSTIQKKQNHYLENISAASLVAQWLRIRLPRQGTRVRALIWEDPTCRGATKPMRHNYWACALEPTSHNYWARVPQLLKLTCLEPVLRNKRSHHNEKPAHHNEE